MKTSSHSGTNARHHSLASAGFIVALLALTLVTGSPAAPITKAATGTDYVVETSETLVGAWTAEAADPPTVGAKVSFPTPTTVKYTFPAGPVKNFARLKVTGP